MMFNIVFCVAGAVFLNIAGCLGQSDVCGQAPLNTKIIGGLSATQGSWPWQAIINLNSTGRLLCSGSLISEGWVMTATICFQSINVSDIVIYLGRQTRNGSNPHQISRTGIQVIKHPEDNLFSNSIALVQLSSSVTFTDYIRPVCLAAADSVFVDGTESWVTGWGEISYAGNFPDVLQELEASIINNIECSTQYETTITDNLICAGFVNKTNKFPCLGDIGSPLVTKQGSQWIQSGVMIDRYCGLVGISTAYARVSEYGEWISNYTSSSLPGFVSYPVISTFTNGVSVNLSSFPLALAFSIITLFISGFF